MILGWAKAVEPREIVCLKGFTKTKLRLACHR
jgi:hypothetical protein